MSLAKHSVACKDCPLRERKIFRSLDPSELAFVQDFKIGELEVDPHATVLAENQATPHLYTVREGILYRHRTLSDGSRQILNFLFPGDLAGLQLAMMGDIHHSITALTHARLCVFQRSRMWTLFKGYPELAHNVTWIAATQETLLDSTIVSLGQRTAFQRIAHFFVSLYKRAEPVGLAREGVLEIPIRNVHISEALGITPVHVSRTLNQLRQSGMVVRDNGFFRLPEMEQLEEAAFWDDHLPPTRPLV